jgi:hypothetical protein
MTVPTIRKVFTKLGIKSRTEHAAVLRADSALVPIDGRA